MISKRALDDLFNCLNCETCKHECKVNSELLYKCSKWRVIILKDLDKLEILEKHNEVLKEQIAVLKDIIEIDNKIMEVFDVFGIEKS